MKTAKLIPLAFLVSLLFVSPVFADEIETAVDGDSSQYPVSITEPEIDVTEPVPQVTLTDADEPVTVEQSEDDKQIVLNVTIAPPNVDVKTESPTVSVSSPVVNLETPAAPAVETASPSVTDDVESDGEDVEPEPVFIPFSMLSLDSDSENDLIEDTVRAVMVSLFGEYRPRTQTVTQVLSDGSEVTYQEYVPGLAGLDVPWLASVGVFMLLLFCLFRLLGGVLSRG